MVFKRSDKISLLCDKLQIRSQFFSNTLFSKMKSDQIIDKIRNKLKESDPENRTVVNIFQFNFTDEDGKLIKSVVFDFKDLNIYEGNSNAVDGEITITDEDFYLVGTKETTFDELITKNKAQVKGDTDAINKMIEKFRVGGEKQ